MSTGNKCIIVWIFETNGTCTELRVDIILFVLEDVVSSVSESEYMSGYVNTFTIELY